MTVLDLAQAGVTSFRRPEWGEGEYIHLDRAIMRGDEMVTIITCWCHAPVPPDQHLGDDERWEPVEGKGKPLVIKVDFGKEAAVPPAWNVGGPMEA